MQKIRSGRTFLLWALKVERFQKKKNGIANIGSDFRKGKKGGLSYTYFLYVLECIQKIFDFHP